MRAIWTGVRRAGAAPPLLPRGISNERAYKHLRKLVGLPYMVGNKEFPAEPPASQEEIQTHIQSISVHWLTIIGFGVPAVILWLMTFKPF
jgi:hypothetical protein